MCVDGGVGSELPLLSGIAVLVGHNTLDICRGGAQWRMRETRNQALSVDPWERGPCSIERLLRVSEKWKLVLEGRWPTTGS
jgi:hypothetical protein